MTMTDFIITKEYKRFSEFCKVCKKDKYIGLCYGPAGVGKTLSAHHHTGWNLISEGIYYPKTIPSLIASNLNIDDLDTIVYTPNVYNTPHRVHEDIDTLIYRFSSLKEQFSNGTALKYYDDWKADQNHVKMIIVDEADRLSPKSLEQLRAMYDQYEIGLIFIGMPGIEKRLVRFPQLYSRVGFIHAYKTLSDDEVRFILEKHCRILNVGIDPRDFSDQESIAAITRITHGNFRLINRLLKQAIRVMEVNQLSSISKEVIEAARECLVIGNVY